MTGLNELRNQLKGSGLGEKARPSKTDLPG